jgi:hypothetical protein
LAQIYQAQDFSMSKSVTLMTAVSLILLTVFVLGCGWYFSNPAIAEDTMKNAKTMPTACL